MTFSNTQLAKNMTSQLFITLRIHRNMSFSNTQLTKNKETFLTKLQVILNGVRNYSKYIQLINQM